jgi:hypothetical protein
VIVVAECGVLWSDDGRATVKLLQICSETFRNDYSNILAKFGWDYLSNVRKDRMADVIKSQLSLNQTHGVLVKDDSVKTLEQLIENCYKEYADSYHESMLLSPSHGVRSVEIIEHAINLTGQALTSSLWSRPPKNPTYWPLQPGLLHDYAQLIRDLLPSLVPQGERSVSIPPRCSLWQLRQRAISAAIPGADPKPADLACAGGGYVAYVSALEMDGQGKESHLTHPRKVAGIRVSAGCLKWEDELGRYTRVTEDMLLANLRVASRVLDVQTSPVRLFTPGGEFRGVPDLEAQNRLRISVSHLVRKDDMARTLYLTTQLTEEASPENLIQTSAIPTQWLRSIDTIAFATHVHESTSRLEQLKQLANDWQAQGLLGPNLRWCLVGRAPIPKVRYITTTMLNEEFRFFEAGNISEQRRVIIRQGLVPLTHCVKVAMENSHGDPEWVIIA